MNGRIEGLDVLRFGAALSVLIYHLFFMGVLEGHYPQKYFFELAHLGNFGVDVFFVISGLVISLSAEGRTAIEFLKARAVRLLPAFYVCATITLIQGLLLPGVKATYLAPRFLASLTFFPRALGSDYMSSVYWTLAVEVQFYGMIAIVLALGWWRRLPLLIVAWLAIALVNQYFLANPLLEKVLLTQFAGHFAAGMVISLIRRDRMRWLGPVLLLGCVAVMAVYVASFEFGLEEAHHRHYSIPVMYAISAATVAIVYLVSGLKSLPLPLRLSTTLGAMSYPLYLLHADLAFFCQAIMQRLILPKFAFIHTKPTTVLWISIALALALAALVALRIEPPLKRWLRDLLNRRRAVPALADGG